MNKEKLESAKNIFFIALWLDIAVTSLVVISDFWGAGILKDIGAGRITADQSIISTLEFWDSFSKLMILTIVGVGLGLVKWLNACYSYAKESLGVSGFKNMGWTVGGWIIPIFNFFKPYQVINEIYKVGGPSYSEPDGWKKEGGSGLLLAWWIFWTVTHFIGWIVGKQILNRTIRDDMTLQQSIGAIEFHAWFCVMFLIVSGLWFFVAGSLTRRLLDRKNSGFTSLISAPLEAMSQSVQPTRFPTQSHIHMAKDAVIKRTDESNQHQAHAQASPSDCVDIDEDTIYAAVAEELESGKTDKGLWTRLYAECNGDERQTKVLYITRRSEKLMASENASREQLALKEIEHQRQLSVEAEEAEKWRRRNSGLADQQLIWSVTKGNWASAKQLLEGGSSPFGTNDEGIPLRDFAMKTGDQPMVDLLRSYEFKATRKK